MNLNFTLRATVFLLLLLGSFGVGNAQNCSVNAGVSQNICAGEKLILHGGSTGELEEGAAVLWTQVGGAGVNIVDPTDLKSEVTGIQPGQSYTFRLYTTCEDGQFVYQDVTHTVRANTIANAGEDAAYCPGDKPSLNANAVTDASSLPPGITETGKWLGSGASGVTVDDVNDPKSSLTISDGASGTANLVWQITRTYPDGSKCVSSSSVIITNRGGSSEITARSSTPPTCRSGNVSVVLTGSNGGDGVDGQYGYWEFLSGPSQPVMPDDLQQSEITVSDMVVGTYKFRWNVVGPCTSGSKEVEVVIPEPVTGGKAVTSAEVESKIFCDTDLTTTTLKGTVPEYAGETVQWSLVATEPAGGSVTIADPSSPVTEVSGLNGNKYQKYVFSYTVIGANSSCVAPVNGTIEFYKNKPEISIVEASPLVLACGKDMATINYSSSGDGADAYRILSGPDNTVTYPTDFIAASGGKVILENLKKGTYEVELSRRVPEGSVCKSKSAFINVVVSGAAPSSNAGTDQYLDCDVTEAKLRANALTPEEGIGTWSQIEGNPVTIADIHDPELNLSGLEKNQKYAFVWLVQNGASCGVSQDTAYIYTSGDMPIAQPAGNAQTVCPNSPVQLDATPKQRAHERSHWEVNPSDGVIFSDETDPKAVVTGLEIGTVYTFKWIIENGCGFAETTVAITVNNDNGPSEAIAGTDQCLPAGTTKINLSGNSPAVGTGTWTMISGNGTVTFSPNANDPNAEATITAGDGNYTFRWTVETPNGCTATTDDVAVTIGGNVTADAGADLQECISAANPAFTLNGNPQPGAVYLWEQVSGGAVAIDNPAASSITVTPTVEGTHIFRYTVTNGACIASDEVRVDVSNPGSDAVVANANEGICNVSTYTLNATEPTKGKGTWTVISGPNAPSFSDIHDAKATVSGLINGEYVLRWTVAGGTFCPVSTADVNLTVTAKAEAGADQQFCVNDITSIALTGTAGTNGTWTLKSKNPADLPDVTITNNADNTAAVKPNGANFTLGSGASGIYTFEYTLSNGTCSSKASSAVTLYAQPSEAKITYTGNDELCEQTQLTLTNQPVTTGTGTWSIVTKPEGATTAFSNLTGTSVDVQNLTYGTYVFRYTVTTGGACAEFDEITINNFKAPDDADAGSNQTAVCADEVTMAANEPTFPSVGQWTLVSKTAGAPDPVIVNPSEYNTVINSIGATASGDDGVYVFRWTISNGSTGQSACAPKSDEVTITAKQLATVSDVVEESKLCNASSASLSANAPQAGETGAWSVVSQTGGAVPAFGTPNAENTTVSGLEPGNTYEFAWTITRTATGCTSQSITKVIDYKNPTTADVSATVTEYCELQAIELKGNTPVDGTGEWTQIAGDPLNIDDPAQAETMVYGAEEGKSYSFRWTISNGTCTASTAEVTIDMRKRPSQADAGKDINICAGGALTATLNGNVPQAGETGEWTFVESDPANKVPTITNPADPNTTVTGLQQGVLYTLKWEHKIGNCSSEDLLRIRVYETVTTADAGGDDEVCNQTQVTLTSGNGTLKNLEKGTWSTISGPNSPVIVDKNKRSTDVTGLVQGTYEFRWRIKSGKCPDFSDDFVTVKVYGTAKAGSDQIDAATCGLTSVTLNGNKPEPGQCYKV